MLGAAPHSRWASKHPRDSSEKSTKSHSGPLQPRPTHTPSRRCAPCSLACFHFFFRELPLLSRPRPAQPLLLTVDPAGSSVFLSPIGVTIAAARPCMFIECVSAKNRRVRLVLVPGLMPAHADPCGDNVSFTGREELILKCRTSAALPLTAYSAACTDRDVPCRLVPWF